MAKVEVNKVGIQLRGDGVTCPAEIRIDEDSVVVVDFYLPHANESAKLLSFEFALVGGTLRLVTRDMGTEPVRAGAITLHDFRVSGVQVVKISGGAQEVGHDHV